MKRHVTIIDYGIGNILSVSRAFHYWGIEAILSDSPQKILNSDCLVLPGVGAFADGWKGLYERNLIEPIRKKTMEGIHFLGICLGMQLMMDYSEEFGRHEGLGIVPGGVVSIPKTDINGKPHKIPHIGWNKIRPAGTDTSWNNTILHEVKNGSFVYFVHSFTAMPTHENNRLADTEYNGRPLSACIRSGHAYGCQFHPEKSGDIGLRMIKNFLDLEVHEAVQETQLKKIQLKSQFTKDDQNLKFRARIL